MFFRKEFGYALVILAWIVSFGSGIDVSLAQGQNQETSIPAESSDPAPETVPVQEGVGQRPAEVTPSEVIAEGAEVKDTKNGVKEPADDFIPKKDEPSVSDPNAASNGKPKDMEYEEEGLTPSNPTSDFPDVAEPSTKGLEETRDQNILSGTPPDEYNVQAGDTLWAVSGQFWGNPYNWPKLWSFNQYITNPHFIYPNNRLVFKPGTEVEPPSLVVEGSEAALAAEDKNASQKGVEEGTPQDLEKSMAEGEMLTEGTGGEEKVEANALLSESLGQSVTLREDGYITKKKEKSLGTIQGSFEEEDLLYANQEVYLKFKDKDKVQVGDLYSVFREEKRVRGTGYLNKILGMVEVLEVKSKTVKGILKQSFYVITRGDQLREYSDPILSVQIQEASNPVEGKIIERFNYDAIDIAEGDLVYINRGQTDGVEPGYQFLVLRRGDGSDGSYASIFPSEIVGSLVVLAAREGNSTALIVFSRDAIKVGDRVSTQLD